MDIKKQREIFRKYLHGTASSDEKAWVEAWYAAFDDVPDRDVGSGEVDDVKAQVSYEIFRRLGGQAHTYRLVRWVVAASVFICIGIGGYFLVFQQPSQHTSVRVSTGMDERRMLLLADSTQLWLNAGTEIRYLPQAYGKKRREIWLEKGEVFLEVAPNKHAPLLVYWDDLEVKVLGTAFNVRAQQGNAVEVGVRRGKVAVYRGKQSLGVLTKGTQLRYDRSKDVAYKYRHATDRIAVWQMDRFALENASFTELKNAFREFYGVEITAGSPHVTGLRFTMEVERTTTATQALEVVCAIHNLKLRKEVDGTIILHE